MTCLQTRQQTRLQTYHPELSMAILGNFETTMIQKQSMVILVNYKDNYYTAQQQQTNQWVLTSVQFNLVFLFIKDLI